MTRHLDTLATPVTDHHGQHACECLARDLLIVAIALRERAGVLHAAGDGRAALAIVELAAAADLIHQRSRRYLERTAAP